MKIVKQSYEILGTPKSLYEAWEYVAKASRNCYQSQKSKPDESEEQFCRRVLLKHPNDLECDHCYTGEVEVLTVNGWVKWRNYKGEDVAVVNKNLTFKGFETPKHIYKHIYSGNFYEYPKMGIKVTDGHNMFGILKESKNLDKFYNECNYELFKCNTYYKDQNGREKTLGERVFKSPRCCIRPTASDPYYELIGFWLGDGIGNYNNKNALRFHLKKERKIKYLEHLCNLLGYKFNNSSDNYYSVESPNIGFTFRNLFYKNSEKYIDLQLVPEQIYSIIQGLINSDGSIQSKKNTIYFSTTSKSIKDWILTNGVLAGYSIVNSRIYEQDNSNCKDAYIINIHSTTATINNDSRQPNHKCIITNESLEVYCVTVSTGLIVVRGTNGITSICGNCSPFEFGIVYLTVPFKEHIDGCYGTNPYSRWETDEGVTNYYITSNLRAIIENHWEADLKYAGPPTKYHMKACAFKLITNRAIMCELTRHRTLSFCVESTRYCNYSSNKFSNELTFVQPCWCDMENDYDTCIGHLENQLSMVEECYNYMINNSWQPQQAATILPNALKTTIMMCGYEDNLKHMFRLRAEECSGPVHPQMKELMKPMYNDYKNWLNDNS